MTGYITVFLLGIVTTFLFTPWVKKLALKIGAVDKPNNRKVHQRLMPRLGGLSIYLGFLVSTIWLVRDYKAVLAILIASSIVVLTGILDDKFQLRPIYKLLGQVIAALVIVFFDLQMEFIHLPFDFSDQSTFNFGFLAIPITILWIVGVTNSINLIDGLDGLATGVSAIATATMLVLAIMMNNVPVIFMASALLGSLLAFLYFNFYPAKIFMGDTGSLFLGFMMAVLSLLGFKQVAFASFIIPLLVLGVPLSDTAFAILRRIVNNKPISAPDKQHLHHCLMKVGFSHRGTVLLIYGISAFFGLSAILFSRVTVWIEVVMLILILLFLSWGAEVLGIVSTKYRPFTKAWLRSKRALRKAVKVK